MPVRTSDSPDCMLGYTLLHMIISDTLHVIGQIRVQYLSSYIYIVLDLNYNCQQFKILEAGLFCYNSRSLTTLTKLQQDLVSSLFTRHVFNFLKFCFVIIDRPTSSFPLLYDLSCYCVRRF